MADPDRATGIDGDQINDGAVNHTELNEINTPLDGQGIIWLESSGGGGQFKWIDLATGGYGVGENIYEVSEGEDSTNQTVFLDKLVYTDTFEAGTYRVAFYCEGKAQTSQTNFHIILELDGVEYCAELGNSASPEEWDTCYGFFQIEFLTTVSHTFKVRYRATKNNKVISIRRARLEIWRMLTPV